MNDVTHPDPLLQALAVAYGHPEGVDSMPQGLARTARSLHAAIMGFDADQATNVLDPSNKRSREAFEALFSGRVTLPRTIRGTREEVGRILDAVAANIASKLAPGKPAWSTALEQRWRSTIEESILGTARPGATAGERPLDERVAAVVDVLKEAETVVSPSADLPVRLFQHGLGVRPTADAKKAREMLMQRVAQALPQHFAPERVEQMCQRCPGLAAVLVRSQPVAGHVFIETVGPHLGTWFEHTHKNPPPPFNPDFNPNARNYGTLVVAGMIADGCYTSMDQVQRAAEYRRRYDALAAAGKPVLRHELARAEETVQQWSSRNDPPETTHRERMRA